MASDYERLRDLETRLGCALDLARRLDPGGADALTEIASFSDGDIRDACTVAVRFGFGDDPRWVILLSLVDATFLIEQSDWHRLEESVALLRELGCHVAAASDIPRERTDAHGAKLFPNGLPDDPDLVDAIIHLDTERASGVKDIDILSGFFNGDRDRARRMSDRIRSARSRGKTSLPPAN